MGLGPPSCFCEQRKRSGGCRTACAPPQNRASANALHARVVSAPRMPAQRLRRLLERACGLRCRPAKRVATLSYGSSCIALLLSYACPAQSTPLDTQHDTAQTETDQSKRAGSVRLACLGRIATGRVVGEKGFTENRYPVLAHLAPGAVERLRLLFKGAQTRPLYTRLASSKAEGMIVCRVHNCSAL